MATGFEACLLAVKTAAPDLTDKETQELFEVLDQTRKRALDDGRAATLAEATRIATDELTNQMKSARLIKARESLLNDSKRRAARAYVDATFADKPWLGVEAKLTGVALNREGARDSAAVAQRAISSEYLGGLSYDLDKQGLKELFTSNAMELETAKALRALETGETVSVPAEAQKIAEVIRKWQEKSRLDQNAEGAWIGSLDDYITRQSHDVTALRKAAGLAVKADDPKHFAAWRDAVTPLLDWSKTNARQFSDNESFLREVYVGLVAGDHLKTGMDGSNGFTGPRNIARSASAERVLHFKDAESWVAYNKQFGTGTLSEAVVGALDRSAHNVGLMKFFGTNPRMMLEQVESDIAAGLRGTPEKLRKFHDEMNGLKRQMSFLDGTTSVPENATLAEWSTAARTFQNMTKLPLMLLSQFNDIATFAADVKFATGKSFLGGMRDAIMGLGTGMEKVERSKFLSQVGVFADGTIHDLETKFGAMDAPTGKAGEYQKKFFSLVGARWWSELMRRRAAETYSHSLGMEVGKEFGALNENVRRAFGVYGIKEADWNAIRANTIKNDGRDFVIAEGLQGETARKFRAFMADRVDYAVLQPGPKTNYYMMWGTDIKRGTAAGEALRFIMQFKSYPIAFTERVLGRDVYGRGADTLGQALTGKNGEWVALAQMVVWTTALGYLSLTAKELAKGKEPRDVTDPGVAWRTFLGSAAQGGGMGIYSDLLFGDAKRGGAGTAEKILGPTISDVAGITDMLQRATRGEDVKAEAFRSALKNAAGVNPYSSMVMNGYPRIALDYLILYRISEEISPGYMRRQEHRMEKENAQSFMFPPSQYAR